MEYNSLVGTWRLNSFEVRSENKETSYPLGRDAVGYLTYTADGYMFLAMMKSDRPRFASEDPSKGSVEEKAAASNSYMTYCGTYTLLGDKVTHHVELSFFPNWKGTSFERIVELAGDLLTLKTVPQLVLGSWQTGYLTWKRA